MTPILFVSMIFPIILHVVTNQQKYLSANIGLFYFVQTFGNFFGILFTSFFLIPVAGAVFSYKLLTVIFVSCSLLLISIIEYREIKIKIFYFSVLISISFVFSYKFFIHKDVFYDNQIDYSFIDSNDKQNVIDLVKNFKEN